MAKTKSHEEFVKEVYALVGDEYTILGTYTTYKEKIRMRHNCEKCNNHEFEMSANCFLNMGYRCPVCGKKKGGKKRTKTQEQFEQEVFDVVGSEYEFLEDYKTAITKIKVRHNCERCNFYEFEVAPVFFLSNGTRCPICANIENGNRLRKTQEQFEQEVFDAVGSEYTVIGEYVNSHTKIKMRHSCEVCNNNEWLVRPNDFLKNSHRCPVCANIDKSKRRTKTHEQFVKEVFDLVGEEYTIIGKYVNTGTKVEIRHNCDKCGNYEWLVIPRNFLSGSRCPACSKSKRGKTKVSK